MDINTIEKVIIPVGSALFGTVVGSVGTTILTNRAAKRVKKAEALKEQLEKLYAPLFFLVNQRHACLDRGQEIMNTWYSLSDENEDMIENKVTESEKVVMNTVADYVEQGINNLHVVCDLMHKNFSYIDPDDVELFSLQLASSLHDKTEYSDNKPKLPKELKSRLSQVVTSMEKFDDRVKTKFLVKKKELNKLTG